MTCGLGLGILVVFLAQAEHVCCVWTKGAQSFQNSNTYVGFPPPDGRLIKPGSYPQNQVRQDFISPGSVLSRSFNAGPAVTSGSGPGLSTRVSQPAQSSVRLVKSSSVFKENGQRQFSPRADAPKGARQSFGLSTAGGPSVSQNQKNPSVSRNWSDLWRMPHPSKYPVSVPREMVSFRPGPAPRQPSRAAAKIPFYHSEVGSASRLFGAVAPGQRGRSVPMQTYARGPAKRVFSNRRSEGQKARKLSPRTEAWKPSVGHRGGSIPKSWLQTYKTSHNLAVPRSSTAGAMVYEIPANFGGFAIRRLNSHS